MTKISEAEFTYEARIAAEKRLYTASEVVHDLPAIFHYWSNRWIRPQLESLGFSGPESMFFHALREQVEGSSGFNARFLSVGCGNCDLEVGLASQLRDAGLVDFVIDCLDLNADMLERGRILAGEKNVEGLLNLMEADFNSHDFTGSYDAILFNQSLHHVSALEHLLDQTKLVLKPSGKLLISDMIGRNGHQRWPSALHRIWQHWSTLPPSYRYNNKFACYEELYVDRDYSTEGFEGIRAEDILPQLLSRFDFEVFFGFGNIIDPFTDRGFGPNFDVNREWDCAFIDQVHAADEAAILAGEVPPTHMLAILRQPGQVKEAKFNVDPQLCIQSRTAAQQAASSPANLYNFQLGQAEVVRESQFLRTVKTQLDERFAEVNSMIPRLTEEVQQQSAWGLGLECELAEANARVVQLQAEVMEKNAWAGDLQATVEQAEAELTTLRQEVEKRSTWALGLEAELLERTSWALALQNEVAELEARERSLSAELAPFAFAVNAMKRWRNFRGR